MIFGIKVDDGIAGCYDEVITTQRENKGGIGGFSLWFSDSERN